MRVLALLLALTALPTPALAQFSLLNDPGTRLERCIRRCENTHSPLATPAPTPTSPPITMECGDGNFRVEGQTLALVRKVYTAGLTYRLCMTVPADAVAPAGILTTMSVNHSNASCNIHHVTLTSPSGKVSTTSGPAPGLNVKFERGKWGVTVWLDPDDARCATNPGMSMWAWWF